MPPSQQPSRGPQARAGVATVEACQAQCRDAVGAADGCEYFFFNGSQPVAKRCLLRLKGVAPPNFTAGVPSKAAVLFEVGHAPPLVHGKRPLRVLCALPRLCFVDKAPGKLLAP